MEDKDRFGEKLRDKGKAAEDLYIAEQERARLQRLKEKAATAGGNGACPRDGAKLEPHTQNGVTIDVCPTCRGVWLDQGEMAVAAQHKHEDAVIHWVRSIFGA
jgi:hypothetical protein